MTEIARTEIAPEQQKTLDELRTSIEQDADANVQAEVGTLQSAIETNDRTEVLSALRVLESRLESLSAIERHHAKLQEAKLAVGNLVDDIDTGVHRGIDAVKSVTVDPAIKLTVNPVLNLAREYVPGAATAIDGLKSTTDAAKEAYAKLPTALRLPVVGAAIAGAAWLSSYPLKWLGSLVGSFSERGQKALETAALSMRVAGGTVFSVGSILGISSLITGMYAKGKLDPAIDTLKKVPILADGVRKASPSTAPDAASPDTAGAPPTSPVAPEATAGGPTYSFEELQSGVTIDGRTMKLLDGPAVEVAGHTWKVKLPTGVSFSQATIENGSLSVSGKLVFVPVSKAFSPEAFRGIVQTLATSTETTATVQDETGATISGISFERV